MDKILEDDRFTHIFYDPKFRRIPKNKRKVNIDKRFQSMFRDKKFTVNFTIDKRGKPSVQSSGENLRKYYNISDSEDDELPDTDSGIVKETLKKGIKQKGSHVNEFIKKGRDVLVKISDKEKGSFSEVTQESSVADERDDETQLCTSRQNENTEISHDIKKKLRDLSVDYARGEGLLVLDSSSDEENSIKSDGDEDINHNWGEFDKEAANTNISTYRLAACNMDWDNIRAVDIMTSLHSFAPSGGLIHSVTIYPSEFGLQRLKDEEVNGPTELIGKCINDLDKEAPTEFCDKLPDFSTYQPRVFTTTALQQEKVELTWDETCTERKEMTRKLNSGRLDELNEINLKTLLAWETSEDESDRDNTENSDALHSKVEKNTINKYKLLLKSIEEQEKERDRKDMQLECSWGLSFDDRSKDSAKGRKRKVETQTRFEEYVDKRREKRKAIRKSKCSEMLGQNDFALAGEDNIPLDVKINNTYFADESKSRYSKIKTSQNSHKKLKSSRDKEEQNAELELVMMDKSEYNSKNHFNMKTIEGNESLTKCKKKRLKRNNKDFEKNQNENFKFNVQDPRFQALFTSHNFNIDPADPHYRKTKATESVVYEKLKRRNKMFEAESTSKQHRIEQQINPELTVLVKSVKRNMDKKKTKMV